MREIKGRYYYFRRADIIAGSRLPNEGQVFRSPATVEPQQPPLRILGTNVLAENRKRVANLHSREWKETPHFPCTSPHPNWDPICQEFPQCSPSLCCEI